MIKKFLSEQSGRTMIEAIGYISIMITITVALTTAVNTGYNRFRLGRVNQQLVDLKKVISQRYVAAENYKDVSFQTLVDEKIVPHEIRDGKHAFGGSVMIGSANSTGSVYFILFDKLPRQACIELGSKLWVVNDGSDLYAMTINSKASWVWKNNQDLVSGITNNKRYLPATVTDVTEACTEDSNNIHWFFE